MVMRMMMWLLDNVVGDCGVILVLFFVVGVLENVRQLKLHKLLQFLKPLELVPCKSEFVVVLVVVVTMMMLMVVVVLVELCLNFAFGKP